MFFSGRSPQARAGALVLRTLGAMIGKRSWWWRLVWSRAVPWLKIVLLAGDGAGFRSLLLPTEVVFIQSRWSFS